LQHMGSTLSVVGEYKAGVVRYGAGVFLHFFGFDVVKDRDFG